METNEQRVENQPQLLCDKYEGELRKQFSGVVPLILSILLTIATVSSFLSVVTSFSKGVLLAISNILPFVFFLLGAIGMWKTWSGAKNSDKHFVDNLNLAKTLPKYQQIMAVLTTILVTIVVFIILVIAKNLKDFFDSFGGVLSAFGGEDIANTLGDSTSIGMGIISAVGILAIAYSVFTVILYANIHKIAKQIMVSYNRKEFPTLNLMFTAVLCFIIAIFEIVSGIMFGFFGTFSVLTSIFSALSLATVGVMLIMFNIKYKEIRE